MKVYITSSDGNKAIILSNIINSMGNAAILSEVQVRDHEDLVGDISEHLNYGFDVHVLISREPVEASLVANKTARIRAVICRTPADARRAHRARANVIIFDSAEFERGSIADIMGAWFSAKPTQGDPAEQQSQTYYQPAPKRGIGISSAGKSILGILGQHSGMVKSPRPYGEKRIPEAAPSPNDDAQKPKKGAGIVKNLKYIFGLD